MTKATIHKTIEDLVLARERTLDFKLSTTSFQFLVDTISTDVLSSVDKFINGAREHGDDWLTGVDHVEELTKEIIDLRFYNAAIKYKQRKYDKRYNS